MLLEASGRSNTKSISASRLEVVRRPCSLRSSRRRRASHGWGWIDLNHCLRSLGVLHWLTKGIMGVFPMSADRSEAHAAVNEPASKARPWLHWYGTVPAGLRYPELTLYEAVAATAQRVPRAVAWDFMDTTETYEQFLRSIDVCADGLAGFGVKAADRLVIAMPTSPQGVIGFYAANKLGAVVAFVHPLSSTPELEHYLNATGARIVLTLDSL
jgi:AMP-binding enzyme